MQVPAQVSQVACAPALVSAAGGRAQARFWEFFVANIRNQTQMRLSLSRNKV
jgi:hypothetical protein